MYQDLKNKSLKFYEQYEKKLEIAFFVGGFIWDVLMMSDVDDLFSLGQQVFYLLTIAAILHYEILFRLHKWRPQSERGIKLWSYRNLFLHFILGSLLSVYSLFYIKSASLVSSLLFLLFMIALLIGNELPLLKQAKVSFKMGLFAICLFSFFSIIFPVALGFVGWLPFGLSLIATILFFYVQVHFLKKNLLDAKLHLQAVLAPGFSVLAAFVIFYFLGWIPPVPLSAKTQGIYYAVEKQNGQYLLTTQRVWWKVWQSGDQDYKARPGDRLFYYAQIYSPARFSDQIYIRWLFKHPSQGWQKTDRIPIAISGGRKEGYRIVTTKNNYQPGEWRVQIETSLGHEISRLNFTVTPDASEEPRDFYTLTR